ncbi:MAG: NAD(P)-dependent oxidoreductase [Alphaproteobacteria bacterium]|jgi:3-hydroxyisobutyrate dehydrogenase-like beta-hydroxyacid dehydrogenase
MVERVGLVGMGLMGQAFILNLNKSQISVQGFDVDPRRMDDLREQGGHPVDSPAEAARGVDYVITSLPNSTIGREAMLGSGGIAEGAAEGLYVCDTTTARPEDSEALGAELAAKGIRFLDSAVSGTSTMARSGDLIVIAGGDKADFEACREVFAGFSRAAYHMGPVGSGARTKLCINLVLAGNRVALAEGLLLGDKCGLDLNNLLEVFKDGACSSKTMVDKGPKMIDADYSQQGQIQVSLKDSRLMIEQAQKVGAPVLMTQTWSQLLQAAYEKGYKYKDSVAFYEILRGMAGLEERTGIDDVPMDEH